MRNTAEENYLARIEELESRLEEAESLIEAIKEGEVDAFAITSNNKQEVFTLQSGDFAYRILVENINEGALNLSEDGLIVYTNKRFYNLLQLPYEKVIGKNIKNFIHPRSLQLFEQLFSRSLNGECTAEIELLDGNNAIPVYISLTSLRPNLDTVGMIVTDLTEKKQAEKEIELKETLQDLFRQSPAAIAIMEGPEFIFASANNYYCALVGRNEEELIGKTLAEAFPETIAQGIIELYNKVYLSGETMEQVEREVVLMKGEKRELTTNFFNSVMQPIKNSKGEVVSIMTHVVDVTEHVTARKKLEENAHANAMLAAIIQSSDDAIISKTLSGIITTWNEGAEKLFGYTAKEIIGQHVFKLIPADRQEEEPEIIEQLTQGKTLQHFETKRVSKDGRLVDISLTISPIKDAYGKIIGASKIARDITVQKIAEAKLKQSENELNELANAVPQLVWIADADGNVIYYNKRIIEFSQAARQDNGIWNWEGLLHPDDLEPTAIAWQDAIKNKTVYEKEHRIRLKDGNYKWFLSRGYPYLNEDGTVLKWYGSATDIDLQKIHETQKDEFLKMVSHELKTPVTSIKGYVQLMLAMLAEDNSTVAEFVRKPLQRIENQVERLGKLISDILDISRLEDGRLDMNKEYFDLEQLVKETVLDMTYAVSTHTIIINDSFSCSVFADKDRIGQVLINLINNAIKYSPGQNKIEVSLFEEPPGFATVRIKDFGKGIEEKEHKRIFERFYQTGGHQDQNYTGFGIGLFISAEIIHRHSGYMAVSSQVNTGSSFTFTLPIKKQV
ncbi:MAG TPA: PAS domain S-box protein [Lacibacter sp.]|nr:PAS domain S-box protein [Lacibacter sp.]